MAEQTTSPISRESSRALLRYAIAAMVIGPVVTALLLGPAMPNATVNYAGPAMMIAVALTGWLFLARGQIVLATNILGCGACLALAGIAAFTGGVRSPVMIVFPVVILIYGWLIERGGVVLTGALIMALTVGLWVAERNGVLPSVALPPALIYLAHAIAIYALATVLMVFILRAFRRQLVALNAVSQQLTERGKQLEYNRELLERAQTVARVGSWVADIAHDRITPSPQGCKIFGCQDGDVLSHHDYLQSVHADDRDGVAQAWAQALNQTHSFDGEHRLVVNGKVRWVRQKAEIEFGPDHRPRQAIGIVKDITERKQMQDEIRQLAFFDPLTQLPNRRLFLDRLNQTLTSNKRSSQHGALMFMDLDNFKPLNDRHGHATGDLLLLEVAARLKACMREMDTVARFGGDEFVVLLSELDTDIEQARRHAATVAAKISTHLAAPYLLHPPDDTQQSRSVEHLCTASIGVVVFSGAASSAHDLLACADAAMYCAKNQGRNCVCFSVTPGSAGSPDAPVAPQNIP